MYMQVLKLRGKVSKFLSSMFVSQTGRVLEGVASDKGQSYPTWHQIWD